MAFTPQPKVVVADDQPYVRITVPGKPSFLARLFDASHPAVAGNGKLAPAHTYVGQQVIDNGGHPSATKLDGEKAGTHAVQVIYKDHVYSVATSDTF